MNIMDSSFPCGSGSVSLWMDLGVNDACEAAGKPCRQQHNESVHMIVCKSVRWALVSHMKPTARECSQCNSEPCWQEVLESAGRAAALSLRISSPPLMMDWRWWMVAAPQTSVRLSTGASGSGALLYGRWNLNKHKHTVSDIFTCVHTLPFSLNTNDHCRIYRNTQRKWTSSVCQC